MLANLWASIEIGGDEIFSGEAGLWASPHDSESLCNHACTPTWMQNAELWTVYIRWM